MALIVQVAILKIGFNGSACPSWEFAGRNSSLGLLIPHLTPYCINFQVLRPHALRDKYKPSN